MDIVFFGTSEFAVHSLQRLANLDHKVLAVVTQPDRKKGRNQQVGPTPVKEATSQMGLLALQPEDLNSKKFVAELKALNAALFVVVSYGNILKKEILDIPSKFCINLHGSLLPKYRGAAPINWAIMNGDDVTGVTVIKMNEKMDAGDIILRKEMPILNSDTADTLSERLALEGSRLLVEAIDLIEKDKAKFQKQDDSLVTYAPKLKKEDGLIDWNKTALDIQNHIRGTRPWPGAYTYLNGKLIKICKAATYGPGPSSNPGEIIGIEKDGILVSTKSGTIIIEELQPESSRRMDINAFLAGHKIRLQTVLGK